MEDYDDATLQKKIDLTVEADAFALRELPHYLIGAVIDEKALTALRAAVALAYFRGAESAMEWDSEVDKYRAEHFEKAKKEAN